MSYRPLKYLPVWLTLGRMGIVAVIVLSLLPLPQIPAVPPQGDKIEHVLAYAVLTFWYSQLCADARALAWRAVAFAALGGALEIVQGMTPYRSAEWLDFVADAAGALLGFIAGLTPANRLLQRTA